MKLSKKKYISLFFIIVAILAVCRCVCPGIAGRKAANATAAVLPQDSTRSDSAAVAGGSHPEKRAVQFFGSDGKPTVNRIYSVPRFCDAFPDSNSVQLASAMTHGVQPVLNRADAEMRKKELVYIGASPYFCVDRLRSSIPYLVPRAASLLNDIGQSFMDSLAIKNIPLHRLIVTSVLRTREDVEKLRSTNKNATANSCHLYGTTFDICYNRYTRVCDPEKAPARATGNDTLKWVMSEVLRDMRMSGRCYIKYEVKQGCFHITVR